MKEIWSILVGAAVFVMLFAMVWCGVLLRAIAQAMRRKEEEEKRVESEEEGRS